MLRRRLILPAAGIALIVSFVLTALGLWAGAVIVSIMSKQLIEQMTEMVHREVNDIITFGDRMSARMVNDIARHDVPFDDPVALRRELYGQVSDEPNIRWLACGNEAGGITDAGRLADGTIVFLMTDDFRAGVYREYEASPDGHLGNLRRSSARFDTREMPWYKKVRDTRTRYWTEPFVGSVEYLLGVALSAPVFNKDGSFAGVCNVRLIFTALSGWMSFLHLSEMGRAFVIDATGHLIAASGGISPVTIDSEGRHQRLLASEADDPVVRQTARHLAQHPEIAASATLPGSQVFFSDDPEHGRIYAAVDRVEFPGELSWTVVSAVPTSDFLGPVYRAAYLSMAVGAFLVTAFLALGLWTVGRTLRPLTALTQAAQGIARGEWRDLPEVRRNDEVGVLAQAFALMTSRLRETVEGLRRSEAKLEEAQQVAHVGYWERNLETGGIVWSNEVYRIFGLAPEDAPITPARVLERIHPEDRSLWSEAVAEAMRGASRYDLDYRVIRPDGEMRIVHSQGDLILDASGNRNFFGTIQDVTERKRAEETLRDVQMELAHANRLTTMGQLAASVAHEVSQPVTATITSAQAGLRWLAADNLAEVRQALGQIIESGRRASDVIGRIRALVKKAPARKDRFDLNEAVMDVIALTQNEVQKRGVALHTQLAPDLPSVEGDRVQVQQVLLNLVLNALEAMGGDEDKARELRIGTGTDEPGVVRVTVSDTGPGLNPADAERLFEAFYTTKSGGLGMGLAISQSIVTAHGGRLWATANAPRGAAFQFTLPAGPAGTDTTERSGSMPAA